MSNNVSKLTDSVNSESTDSKQPAPNRGAETREYFKLLDPENPEAFTLQVFDDNEQRKDITLAATLHGSFDNLKPLKGRFTSLKEANLAGCGIYCTVSETNGKGREASDIVRFRAVWVDDDNKDGKSGSRVWPIEPTFIVQTSPGKFQAYWCVTDKWLADEQGKAEFNGVIERLVAEHYCDKGAKGINRVLRVPGSLHLKNPNKPFIIRLVKRDGPRYTREQILAAFPPLLQSAETSKKNSVGTVTSEWKDLITNVITGENYHDTLTVLAAKMLRSGMNAGAVVNLLRALMESSEGPHDDRWKARYLEIQRAVSSAEKKGIAAVPEKNLKHTVEDFVAYRPSGNFIFIPTRDMWPANSVNASVWPVDVEGKEKPVPAASWIAAHRAVEQMTWAPGEPMEIHDKLIAEGGWIKHPGCTVFNLYRPPVIVAKAGSVDLWLNHLRCLYPDEAEHILCWLAHRVQKPQEKINHGLVFGGAHGIGKDSLLEPVKHAVGSWNFLEANPKQIMGRFNTFLKSVILRVSEAHDLGDVDRYAFYECMKTYMAAPPDVLRVDQKHVQEYAVLNVVGIIITSNHKTDGLYLPADDRRHFVAWTDKVKEDFTTACWDRLHGWYANGGNESVAGYLQQLDISGFNAKAPPPKTAAFHEIVGASRAPEDAELADVLEAMGEPAAVTIDMAAAKASELGRYDFAKWLRDGKNARKVPYRLEACGYVRVENPDAKGGRFRVGGSKATVYCRRELSLRERVVVAKGLA